jgi:hypothetical protein
MRTLTCRTSYASLSLDCLTVTVNTPVGFPGRFHIMFTSRALPDLDKQVGPELLTAAVRVQSKSS